MRLIGQLIIIALITLALAEIGARLLLPIPGLQPFPPSQPPELLVSDPIRSFAYRPGFNGKVHEEANSIDVKINALGMRDDPVQPNEHIEILAIGDSFTVGYMVEAAQAWPARLEYYLGHSVPESQRIRVLNAAVSGYSMEQIRLTAEKYAYLHPDIVVAGVLPFVADRLVNPYQWFEGYAVRAKKIPFLRKVEGGFLTANPDSILSAETQFWMMQNFRFGAAVWMALRDLLSEEASYADSSETTDTDALLDLLKKEILKLRDFTKVNGQKLVILLIGFQQPDGIFSESVKRQNGEIRDFCIAQGIPVYDPLPLLEENSDGPNFRISPGDYHWTPRAHDFAASGLSKYLETLEDSRM
jgi:hypothetical protein